MMKDALMMALEKRKAMVGKPMNEDKGDAVKGTDLAPEVKDAKIEVEMESPEEEVSVEKEMSIEDLIALLGDGASEEDVMKLAKSNDKPKSLTERASQEMAKKVQKS
ncbi:hypothetical protein [Microcystis sp. M061S2]|uniref:hypothetical protein n=1 Tax=Microcystis sp. M061S2 TaxID=2771171 RepID=UPI00258848CB|nr:hypothetical protein [Microcystis sp. M061S2]MCA2656869.1 hypothetical protein [Microcystis sp. M061S2]